MKPERNLIAERPLAQHCPELLRPVPTAGELLPTLAQLGDRLARALGTGLARLAGSEAPTVQRGEPRECTMSEVAAGIAPLAANSLMTLDARKAPFLASVEATAVFRMVDRAFGGRGQVPEPLPTAFPMSAQLLTGRLETLVATAIDEALGPQTDGSVRALNRDGSLEVLAPFADETQMIALTLDVHETAPSMTWQLTLAFPVASLTEILGEAQPAPKPGKRNAANPAEEPFGEVPLSVIALLVDMRIGFSKLSALKPGDILPVAVARRVPLTVGDKIIAHGSIGEVDDRVAVQITHAF